MRKSNRTYMIMGLCFIVIAILFTLVGVRNLNNELTDAESQLSEIISSNEENQAKLDAARDTYEKKLAQVSISNVGTDSAKIKQETQFITETIKPAYSWIDDNTYNEARGTIESQIGSDNIFMKNILPSLDAEHISLNEQDLHMKCMKFHVFPATKAKGHSAYYALVEYIQYYGEDIQKQDHLTRNRHILYVVMDSSDKIKSIKATSAEDIRVYDTGNN